MSSPALTSADYPELRRRLEAAIRRVCPSWLADHSEDLVQVAILKVARAVEQGQGANTAFLYRVAHSVVVDEIRKARRRREESMTPSAPDRVASTDRTAPQLAEDRQVGAAILDCLSKLHEDRRRAVTLHLQGHTVPETGRLLGFADKKAENLVYRGMADLRACLEKKGVRP
jgi:RNA polymerase sigma-70 factor (ECF subfamily)